MLAKEMIENLIQSNGYIKKAAKKAEEKSHICEKLAKDILDEIGDCLQMCQGLVGDLRSVEYQAFEVR